MSRKRKSDQEPNAESTPALPTADTATAVAEPPAAHQNDDSPGFAERVGQKQWTAAPDPFGIAKDNLAGVRLLESRQDHLVAIKFGEGRPEDKPSQAVIDKVKEAGFRWNPAERVWVHPLRADSAMATRIDAEKLYQEVRQMIRQEKGIEATPDIPF